MGCRAQGQRRPDRQGSETWAAPPYGGAAAAGLERDVVVARGGAGARGGRAGGLEVARVGGNVGPGGEAVAAAASARVVAAAEELHGLGDDLDVLALVAVLVLPLAPLQAPVDRDRAALGEEAGAVLSLRAPDRDVEEVGLVLPVTGRRVAAARVAGHPQRAHRRPAPGGAELGITREVACADEPVDVGGGHEGHLSTAQSSSRSSVKAESRPGSGCIRLRAADCGDLLAVFLHGSGEL